MKSLDHVECGGRISIDLYRAGLVRISLVYCAIALLKVNESGGSQRCCSDVEMLRQCNGTCCYNRTVNSRTAVTRNVIFNPDISRSFFFAIICQENDAQDEELEKDGYDVIPMLS